MVIISTPITMAEAAFAAQVLDVKLASLVFFHGGREVGRLRGVLPIRILYRSAGFAELDRLELWEMALPASLAVAPGEHPQLLVTSL